MKLSHKRKVKLKLNKSRSTLVMSAVAAKKPVAKTVAKPVAEKPVAKKAEPAQSQVAVTSDIALTPKQQQVLDILRANPEGINPKGIGLEAGQEDGKAASWATGALKKLTEEGVAERIQLAGNKVVYKAL